MVRQNGNVRQGAPYAPNTVFIAPNTAAVAAAPPALNASAGVEFTKNTPTAMLQKDKKGEPQVCFKSITRN